MSESTSSPLESLASSLTETDGAQEIIGYQCDKLVADNELVVADLTYYIDLMWPNTTSTEDLAVKSVRMGLLDAVASTFGISSGVRCKEPPENGETWLVKVTSESSQYERVPDFAKCRELVPGPDQDCAFYELMVTVHLLGGNEQSIKQYIESLLKGEELMADSPFEAVFQGTPVVDPNKEARDSLADAARVKEAEDNTSSGKKNQNITIVGGLLVAAFCMAFIGIIFVVWRRRKYYLRSRDVQLALSKSDLHYDTRPNASDDELPRTLEKQSDSDDFEDLRGGKSEEEFPNNVTFDLGNSFKDQLMGVHGTSQRNKLGGIGGIVMHPFGVGGGDGASDSDADSWAQTDGTIGSLELQLEPITAEV